MRDVKTRTWIVLAVLALAGALTAFWVLRSPDEASTDATEQGPSDAEIVAAKRAKRSELPEERGPATASGQVTRAADGSAVAGALVLLNTKGSMGGVAIEKGQRSRPLIARTDDAGNFRFEAVPPGSYALSATADGLLPGRISSVVLSADSDTKGLDLALASGGHRLSGAVSDIVGGAVDGATVHVFRLDDGNAMAAFSKAPSATVANEEGRYELWLSDGAYVLTAEHPDYVTAHSQISIDGGDRNRDIQLTPGGVIEGRVVTRDGAAMPGAFVTWASTEGVMQGNMGGGGNMAMGMEALERVETDAEGRFRINGLEPGLRTLKAVADGWATKQPVDVPLGVAEEVTGIELVLDKALKISGFVVKEGDEESGLEGVLISAFSMQPPAVYLATAPSEKDGYFEILGVQPGTYFLGAFSEEALPSLMTKSVTVTDTDVDDVLLTLGTGIHIRGRVEPAVSASIKVEIDMQSLGLMNAMKGVGNGFVRDRTTEEGSFDLFPVAGNMKVFLVAETDDGRKGRQEVELGSEDVDDVLIELEPKAMLAGTVVDANGAPVEGVEVSMIPTFKTGPGLPMSFDASGKVPGAGELGSTDETGSYRVRGLEAGTYRVRVNQAQGPALAWAEPADADDPTEAIEVTLAEAEQREGFELRVEARDGVIRGIVVGSDGEPVADAWVRATREQSAGEYWEQVAEGFRAMAGAQPQKEAKSRKKKTPKKRDANTRAAARAMAQRLGEAPVLTDASGRFEIDGLRDGTYLVIADGPRGSGRAHATGVTLGSDIELEVEPLGGIEGVVKSDGKALAQYTVTVDGPEVRSRVIKDESGRFSMTRLDPGTYEVTVDSDEGTVQASVEVEASAVADVAMKLEPFAKVRGKLVDANTGEGIGGMTIMALDRASDPTAMMSMFSGGGNKTDDDGSFEVDRIRPGKGSITFLDPDAEGWSTQAVARYEVEPGDDLDLGTINGVGTADVPVDERGHLGLSTRVATFAERPLPPDADDGEDEEGDDDPTPRLWVNSVTVDGPASVAGVEPGDEIVSVRNVEVQSMGASAANLSLGAGQVRAGEAVSLEIRRDGMTRHVTVDARARGT